MAEPTPVHCYTNPSFCRQSESIEDRNDLPPPPDFQVLDDLPPPPPPISVPIPIQSPQNYQQQGLANPAFQNRQDIDVERCAKTPDRYCYLEEAPRRDFERKIIYDSAIKSRYEYIDDEEPRVLQRRASLSRFETMTRPQQFLRQGSYHGQQLQGIERVRRPRQDGNERYGLVPADEAPAESLWTSGGRSSPRGRYARVPQEEEPPVLPERNFREQLELRENTFSSRNNLATQKLHEILTTPRKPRSKSEDRNLSPGRLDRNAQRGTLYTPNASASNSPSGRGTIPGSSRRDTPVGTPQRVYATRTPQTSTPNKEAPSARRCLPLNEQQEICPASNCGRARYATHRTDSLAASPELTSRFGEPPPRYAYLESGESMPMVIGSPKYQVLPSQQKRSGYDSVESAFIARTAVVPPLSPPSSDANTTLASGLEKGERKSAPLLLVLVGILTCGLALYLSWTQGRKYYLDSAAGCGVCCALAGACRSLRRTWTGLGLAGLAAVSCAGLLLLAAKAPRAGTPLHDVTAGALCGVSLLGAGLALLALISPRCSLGRHRRVHSWMPRFSP